jgi:prevent-host-death family protein
MEQLMAFTANDVVPLSQARAMLSELADQVKAGAEKIITKNGESYVAIVDAARLDYYHQLEREQIHLLIIDDACKGLDDVAAGKVKPASAAINVLKRKRRVA